MASRAPSAQALREAWESRDVRYAASRQTLDEDSIASVRAWRLGEASKLRPEVREDAETEASMWTPPPRIR